MKIVVPIMPKSLEEAQNMPQLSLKLLQAEKFFLRFVPIKKAVRCKYLMRIMLPC